MNSELNKKNPSSGGHPDEGIKAGNIPNINKHSIAHNYDDFNRVKFDIRLLQKIKGSGGQYTALCPAHEDRKNSLSVKIAGDRVLLHCFAGCSPETIMGALGLPMSALFLEDKPLPLKKTPKQKPKQVNSVTYEYLNPDGSIAYRKTRYEYSDGSKTFAFYTPDGKKGISGIRRVPYNLPAVLSAETVYFVEGEKAADAVIQSGRVAVSLDAGANSKWLSEYNAYFEGKNIVILPDNDIPGMNYAISIAGHLPGSKIVKLPGLPEKGDVYDWLANGRTMDEIQDLGALPQTQDLGALPQTQDLGALPQTPQGSETLDPHHEDFLPDEPGFIAINPFETKGSRNRYRWNDIGISNLFADCYKNLSRYVPETKSWYIYDGRMWKQDTGGVKVSGQGKKFMYYLLITCLGFIEDDDQRSAWAEFVVKRMRKQARDIMIADAASCHPVSIMEFDKDPYMFNCLNCTLNLRNFSIHKHNPDNYLSKVANVDFNENAQCTRWDSFISEIMRGDVETERFLQKALGYTLTGDTSEECFFILYGSTTRNGKGTTMETTLHMLGDYGRTAQPETVAQKQFASSGNPSEDIARLKGARFVNMSEPDKGLRLNSALVKQVTGGDSVTARFLHQNSFEYRPEYKLFINTNHLPRVTDDSIFASGRVKLIPFERHFTENEQDKGLKTFFKESENVSGILNWFLKGLKMMQTEGLEQPESVRNATAQYREESDTIGLFISECLGEMPGHRIPIKEIRVGYEKWCDEYGYNPLGTLNFNTELRRKGLTVKNSTRDKNQVCLFDFGLTNNDSELPSEFMQ